ncbi:MAG: hypothetical protein QMB54_05485 [Neofamilia sp.]
MPSHTGYIYDKNKATFVVKDSNGKNKTVDSIINIDGKKVNFGSYATMVEAAKARDMYAIEKFGSDCGPTNKDIGIY